jgi:hypothetical protein
VPRKYASMRERLDANALETEPCAGFELPCRLWTGGVDSGGRPKMTVRSRYRDATTGHRKTKMVSAVRMSLAEHLGLKIWQLNFVLHRCDRKRCIEPTHLYSSTQKRNVKDCIERGRHKNAYGPTGKGKTRSPAARS